MCADIGIRMHGFVGASIGSSTSISTHIDIWTTSYVASDRDTKCNFHRNWQ